MPAKNRLTDLNDHLFSQLERLSAEDITSEDLTKEIERSKAICQTAGFVINNARLALDSMKEMREVVNYENVPEMLRIGNAKK